MDRPELNKPNPADAHSSEAAGAARYKSWVDELIAMTRPGLDMELPDRAFLSRIPPYGFDDFN